MMSLALGILLCFSPSAISCVAVQGDQILVKDLAQSITEFATTPGDNVVSFAPLPGTQRNFTVREALAAARRFGIQLDARSLRDICFVREVHQMQEADFQAALIAATEGRASVEILDYGRVALPAGRLEFLLSQVILPPNSAPETAVLWRGRLVSAAGRSYPTWVRARILADRPTVVAKEQLVKGQVIRLGQVELRVLKRFPFSPGLSIATEAVVGKVVKYEIASGQSVHSKALEEPKEVEPGDTVRVESSSGMAQINFDARAKTGGRRSDTVLIQNPGNGRSFRAVVTGKGQVRATPIDKNVAVNK